jgi:hypothetical protein
MHLREATLRHVHAGTQQAAKRTIFHSTHSLDGTSGARCLPCIMMSSSVELAQLLCVLLMLQWARSVGPAIA